MISNLIILYVFLLWLLQFYYLFYSVILCFFALKSSRTTMMCNNINLIWNFSCEIKSVLTWHSYMPWSLRCTNFICSVQVLVPGVCKIPKRSSFVYIWSPEDRMCQSRRRIQVIWFCEKRQKLGEKLTGKKSTFLGIGKFIVIS